LILSGDCYLYGNACYGGYGKRNEQQTNEKSVDLLSDQIWPTPNWNPTGTDEPSTLIQIQDRGRNTNPLHALQLVLYIANVYYIIVLLPPCILIISAHQCLNDDLTEGFKTSVFELYLFCTGIGFGL
jgi:hypothetical protein